MNKIIKQFTYILGLAVTMFAVACSDDIAEEITTLETSRLFSPVDLETRILNQTSVRVSWKVVEKAETYTVEIHANGDENYEGTPLRTATVTFGEVPYTFTGFDGATTYSVRVKAQSEEIAESKWISKTFSTDEEQIFQAMVPDDIVLDDATLLYDVNLYWPAGESADRIVVTPGDMEYIITADDIAAGSATIAGLTGEIEYTAKMYRGEKTRGTATFTTPVDLTSAIRIEPGVDLAAAIAGAGDGAVLAVFPGEYIINNDVNVNASIAIKAVKPGDKPVIKGLIFRMKTGAALELRDLVFDGTGSLGGNQFVIYDAGTFSPFIMDNTEIKNYTKGTFYVNNATNIESVLINNCIYSDIICNGGDFIDFRNGLTPSLTFTNNTVYNSALARDLFRMDAGGSNNFPGVVSVINISNNTFYNVSNGNNRRILYIRLADNAITFNNNILSNTLGYYTNQASTDIKEMKGNNYHEAPNFTASTQTNAKNDEGTYTTFNPGFKNAATGDFTISHESLKENGIGAARWR